MCVAFALWPGWQLALLKQCLHRAVLCMADLDAVWTPHAGISSLMAGSEVERASNGGTQLKLPLQGGMQSHTHKGLVAHPARTISALATNIYPELTTICTAAARAHSTDCQQSAEDVPSMKVCLNASHQGLLLTHDVHQGQLQPSGKTVPN